jgi:hypothetical protein
MVGTPLTQAEILTALMNDVVAQVIFDALRRTNRKALMWGDVSDVLIDGHFDLKKVAHSIIKDLREKGLVAG